MDTKLKENILKSVEGFVLYCSIVLCYPSELSKNLNGGYRFLSLTKDDALLLLDFEFHSEYKPFNISAK